MALYKLNSAKPGVESEAVVVDGGLSEGGRRASFGDTIELSDAEHEVLSQSFNFSKVDGKDKDNASDEEAADVPADDAPPSVEESAGADAGGGDGVVGTSSSASGRTR